MAKVIIQPAESNIYNLLMFFMANSLTTEKNIFFSEYDENINKIYNINVNNEHNRKIQICVKGIKLIYDDKFIINKDAIYMLFADNGFYRSHKYFLNESTKKQLKLTKIEQTSKKSIGIYFDDTGYKYYETCVGKLRDTGYNFVAFGNIDKAQKFFDTMHIKNVNYIEKYDDIDSILEFVKCEIKICTFSLFSLCGSYLAEILDIGHKNYFPENLDGCVDYSHEKYDIYDLIPIKNDKYEIVRTDEKIYGIFLIATGNYKQYLKTIIEGIKKSFLTQNKKILLISIDDEKYMRQFEYLMDDKLDYVCNKIYHLGFPGDTLYRFEYFLRFVDKRIGIFGIQNVYDFDYLMFINLNINMKEKIDTLSLNDCDLFFTLHPGNKFTEHIEKNTDSFESNPKCKAYVKTEHKTYICGGFNGGKPYNYLKMANCLAQNIMSDDLNNIVAKWHDETHINWYYNDILTNVDKKTNYKLFSYYYCSPANDPYVADPYMSPINKQHEIIRHHDYYILEWQGNIIDDIVNMCDNYCISNKMIGLEFFNSKYNSSRQGILKNIYRTENNKCKHAIPNKHIKYNSINVFSTINMLNIDNSKNEHFRSKYGDHILIFSRTNDELFDNIVYDHIKSSSHKYIITFYSKKLKTLENVNYIQSNDDGNELENQLIQFSTLSSFICNNGNDAFVLSMLSKYKFKNDVSLLLFGSNITAEKKHFLNYEVKFTQVCDMYIRLNGGLGNQLFMLFTGLSIATDLKINNTLITSFDRSKRFPMCESTLFSFKIDTIEKIPLKQLVIIKEKTFKFEELVVNNGFNYIIDAENSGYFQSYKYFWKNKSEIKKQICISEQIKNNIMKIVNNIGKKIMGIHIRLTDYTYFKNYHFNLPSIYYDNSLQNFDIDEYQIILFSDDVDTAQKFISKINELNNKKIILARDLCKNDYEEFLLLSYCDVIIGANSTYSLWASYINEIYELNPKSTYVFPNIWFAVDGPDYDINDLIPRNDKYIIQNVYKCAVIFFHKNIYKLYEERWIDKCVKSVLDQKKCEFDIFEVNYGNENVSVFKNVKTTHNKKFYIKNYQTHTEAMMFLLTKCFDEYGYDIVFNTNLDDYYDETRFINQLCDINNGSYLNSTMWHYIKQYQEGIDESFNEGNNHILFKDGKFIWESDKKIKIVSTMYNDEIPYSIIKQKLTVEKDNILNHSGICFTKKFWNSFDKFGNKLRYRDDKPYEDLSLWARALDNNIPVSVINKNLIHYRIHSNQIGEQQKTFKKCNIFKKDFKAGPDMSDKRIVNIKRIKNIDDIENLVISDKNIKYLFVTTTEELSETIREKAEALCNNFIIILENEYDPIAMQIYGDVFYENNELVRATCEKKSEIVYKKSKILKSTKFFHK